MVIVIIIHLTIMITWSPDDYYILFYFFRSVLNYVGQWDWHHTVQLKGIYVFFLLINTEILCTFKCGSGGRQL